MNISDLNSSATVMKLTLRMPCRSEASWTLEKCKLQCVNGKEKERETMEVA